MSYCLGITAALICFLINRELFKRVGYQTIVSYSPILEEFCKSFPAYWLSADILLVHLVFGAIEGSYECWQGKRRGVLPGLLSGIGHFLFGLLTITVWQLTANIGLGVAASCGLHLLWNISVVKLC